MFEYVDEILITFQWPSRKFYFSSLKKKNGRLKSTTKKQENKGITWLTISSNYGVCVDGCGFDLGSDIETNKSMGTGGRKMAPDLKRDSISRGLRGVGTDTTRERRAPRRPLPETRQHTTGEMLTRLSRGDIHTHTHTHTHTHRTIDQFRHVVKYSTLLIFHLHPYRLPPPAPAPRAISFLPAATLSPALSPSWC